SMTAECLRRAVRAYEEPADPTQAFNSACRYLAARCSALAGCGLGKDGDRLSEAERARWRKLAREWLRADLAMWAAKLGSGSPQERNLAKRMLRNWQADPDLAGLREVHALDEFSADERNDCLALWREVRALLKRTGQSPTTAALGPKRAGPKGPSPTTLMRLGQLREARAAWKSILEAEPFEH